MWKKMMLAMSVAGDLMTVKALWPGVKVTVEVLLGSSLNDLRYWADNDPMLREFIAAVERILDRF